MQPGTTLTAPSSRCVDHAGSSNLRTLGLVHRLLAHGTRRGCEIIGNAAATYCSSQADDFLHLARHNPRLLDIDLDTDLATVLNSLTST
jgi:hypothetical protein